MRILRDEFPATDGIGVDWRLLWRGLFAIGCISFGYWLGERVFGQLGAILFPVVG